MRTYFILFIILQGVIFTAGSTEVVLQLNQLPTTYRAPSNFDMKAEQWLYSANDDIFLIGGKPRGTIYAAYHFLEDINGVHWWTPWGEESVPANMATISGTPTLAGVPAFAYREVLAKHTQVTTEYSEKAFYARNRNNGDGSNLGEDYGWKEKFGGPRFAHGLMDYVSHDDYGSTNPEYFALLDPANGTRSTIQLCLTNEDVYDIVESKLLTYLANDRATALAGGQPMPYRYDVSLPDTGAYCLCSSCAALMASHGDTPSALIINFLNDLGDAIKDEYPEVVLSVLAYRQTQVTPTNLQVADNVSIRIAGLDNNLAQPLSGNDFFDTNVQDWSAIAKHTSNWNYQKTFGKNAAPNFVTVNMADDLRYCRDNGMEGTFFENQDNTFTSATWEMNTWVAMKLQENPDLSIDTLIDTFCTGYYGTTAGNAIRQYVSLIQAEASNPGNAFHFYNSLLLDFTYVDYTFVAAANGYWETAEASASGVQLQRVKNARLGFDRYVLHAGQRLIDEYVTDNNNINSFSTEVIDLKAAAERCIDTLDNLSADRFQSIYFTTGVINAEKADMEEFVTDFTDIAASSQLPSEIANNEHFIFYPKDLTIIEVTTQNASFIIDPELGTRHAIAIDNWSTVNTSGGIYDTINEETRFSFSLPGTCVSSYHWHELGTGTIGPDDYMYLLSTWEIRLDSYKSQVMSTDSTNATIWAEVREMGLGSNKKALNRIAIVFNN